MRGASARRRLRCTGGALLALARGEGGADFVLLRGKQRLADVLRENEERYRNMFDTVPIGLYRSAANGRLQDANPALATMLGYESREALLAESHRYRLPHDTTSAHAADGLDGVPEHDVQIQRRDGSHIWAVDLARAYRDEGRQVVYFEGAIRDISARKQMEIEPHDHRPRLEGLGRRRRRRRVR